MQIYLRQITHAQVWCQQIVYAYVHIVVSSIQVSRWMRIEKNLLNTISDRQILKSECSPTMT